MKASDLFLECLRANGVKTIYGVPGEENADIMISLLDSDIEFITCRHEQEAAFMADMEGRLTGKPGVCLATLGPGATNLATGIISSQLDKLPLVAIIGQAATNRLHKESHQNMKTIEMYQPVTKWSTTIRDEDVIPEVVAKAFKLAVSEKPGAIVIELPEDIAKHQIDAPALAFKEEAELHSSINKEDSQKLLAMLQKSSKPLLLIGSSACYHDSDAVIREFVKKTGIYAATTFMGKGVVSAENDRSLQTVGLGMKDIALSAFEQSDLVVTIGYDMIEWHPDRWNIGVPKKIVHIDTAPSEVDKHYMPDLELVGDINSIVHGINESLTDDSDRKDATYFAELRQEILADLAEKTTDDQFPVKPQRILHDLRSVMGEHDVLISDVGAHKMWVARQYPAYHSKTCFIHNGCCAMGGALPGAFVVKRKHPEKNVVALCGDGGFMMSIQALPTMVRHKVAATILVWEDDAYGLIKWKQEMSYKKHSHIDLHNEDLVGIAKAFGCHAQKATSAEELEPALHAAFAEKDKPTVIVVPVDYSENMKLTKHLGDIFTR